MNGKPSRCISHGILIPCQTGSNLCSFSSVLVRRNPTAALRKMLAEKTFKYHDLGGLRTASYSCSTQSNGSEGKMKSIALS